MLEVDIPGRALYRLEHLVLDVNGTIACDGHLLPGVAERLAAIRRQLTVHLVSADTYGRLDAIASALALPAMRLDADKPDAEQKAGVVNRLGAHHVVAIGNGANDVGMLRAAILGIVVAGPEGVCTEALLVSDVVVTSVLDALDLLQFPKRLIATLRR